MQKHEKVIILRAIKYSEADLIIHGLNVHGARMNFIAKSALKSRRRFGGGILEPTHYIEAEYREKSGHKEDELLLLTNARLLESFQGLRQNYERLELAFYFLQLISKVCQEGTFEDASLFDLLGNGLKAAERTSKLSELRTLFELKLLHHQGVLPPDLPAQPFMQHSLKAHEAIEVTTQEMHLVRSRLNLVMGQYLT